MAVLAANLGTEPSSSARLFFAAWPAPSVQRALGRIARDLQRECGGRAVPTSNIHLTLVFLGDVARDRLAELESCAAALSAPRFDMSVNDFEYWRHNRIVWAGPDRCPEALPALVEQLGQALVAKRFRIDRRPYLPHITLVRGARRAPVATRAPAVPWGVDAVALVESVAREEGRAYQVLREWPLSA